MNILVTGSSGLIGTSLIDRLQNEGHRVARMRRGRPAAANADPPISDVAWDPVGGTVDRAGLAAAGPFDGVVHLAGAGIGDRRWSAARKRVIVDSRTASTSLLVDALLGLAEPPPVLISASAVGYYGIRGDEELTEESAPGTDFLASVCTDWEAAARPAADGGVRTVLLRSGIVLSRHGGALGKQLPLFRLGLGGRMGSGDQYRSWITLDDEIGVIMHCLQNGSVEGPINSTAPAPVTERAMARAIGSTLHRPSALAVPSGALRLALGSEMATELILGGQRVLPAALLRSGYAFAHTEVDEALRSVLAPT